MSIERFVCRLIFGARCAPLAGVVPPSGLELTGGERLEYGWVHRRVCLCSYPQPRLVMHARIFSGWSVALATFWLIGAPAMPAAGLYDTGRDATSGELDSQDYWWTKFDAMMLDLAIQQRQPEGRIAVDLASTLRRVDDLEKAYPKHEEIKKMKARFEEVQSKIDTNANRSAAFTTECPWDESNFAQLWVNWHWAKAAAAQRDWATARSCLQNVERNYEIMLQPGRMKDYPEELRKWVVDSKPEADKLNAEARTKTRG